VWLTADASGGFLVHSFAGDDPLVCRDHVRRLLGLGDWRTGRENKPALRVPTPTTAPAAQAHPGKPIGDTTRRIELAVAIWRQTVPLPGMPAESYLSSRGLRLEGEDFAHVLRFHPSLSRDGAAAAGMVALYRDAMTNEACGIHRTFLDADGRPFIRDGRKDRRMLGRAKGAAIKLDADAEVYAGLHIGEGIETCLAARQLGYRPTWALGSAGAIADFPVLDGIEALTVFTENDEASTRAAESVCDRYEAAGCEAWMLAPPAGDINDAIRQDAP
jgi:hypothetical protein